MISKYTSDDRESVTALWNRCSSQKGGYAPRNAVALDSLLFRHSHFSPEHAFVYKNNDEVRAFICGCTGDDIPRGAECGCFTGYLADEAVDTDRTAALLFDALEDSFRAAGKKVSSVTFFNPMKLPWVMPGTPGFEHNNMPGIGVGLPLHERMLARGYAEVTRECAMYLDLDAFTVPEEIEAFSKKAAAEGHTVELYDASRHTGLREMLDALGNPEWIKQITEAADKKMVLPVALFGNIVAGFTGPVYPEPTGRGYFAGIGVAPEYQHYGMGTLLFYRLLEMEKKVGSRYMSLFTDVNNHAKNIYLGAGFQIAETFSVMKKEL